MREDERSAAEEACGGASGNGCPETAESEEEGDDGSECGEGDRDGGGSQSGGDETPEPNSAGGQDSPVSVQSTPPREVLGLTWNEDLFNTPTYGNSGPPQAELTEMCIGLLEFFGRNHPDIASKLSFGLIIFGSFPCL